ncbi:MAG: isoprenylcysteine carboxylmethyltransferase family protein [Anaerolineae bacterium]|nr:isoprenylcysteine carboxylmethyltransferase family protein [Anaerolineae bacterium]MDW8100352.1 isoprenylcysteine carboxylmethyltransferase family protein [Anaerolineae bacterium]
MKDKVTRNEGRVLVALSPYRLVASLPLFAQGMNSPRRTRREWALDVGAATLWAIYAGAYLQRALTAHRLMDLGLFLFYSVVVWLFVTRAPAQRHAPWPAALFAWGSTVLPVLGLSSSPVGWQTLGMIIQGLSLVSLTVAALSLGRSFAIAPADRGLRTGGAYRWIRHPMYASELMFYAGYLLANWSWRNLAVGGLVVLCVLIRIHYEEQLIAGYHEYARQVRWRLIPRVW